MADSNGEEGLPKGPFTHLWFPWEGARAFSLDPFELPWLDAWDKYEWKSEYSLPYFDMPKGENIRYKIREIRPLIQV